jgi:hypothetical protein
MEDRMGIEQQALEHEQEQAQDAQQPSNDAAQHADTDGLKDKKPEELTPDELRLMADTMPGEGPGD